MAFINTSEIILKYLELGLSSTILRLFNVYGPDKFNKSKTRMISIYCSYILNKKINN